MWRIWEAQIGFVHQGGGGKRVVRAFGRHQFAGERAQLAVHERNQFVAG
jgi:hypothetical protein